MIDMDITPADRKKYPYHTEDSIKGILYIQSLPSSVLAGYAHDYANIREQMSSIMGDDTNPNWTMSQVATELYERNVIDEKVYDKLMED